MNTRLIDLAAARRDTAAVGLAGFDGRDARPGATAKISKGPPTIAVEPMMPETPPVRSAFDFAVA